MQEITPKEVLAWWEALVENGPADVHETLLPANLALALLQTHAPVTVQYGPWSLRCREGPKGLRRTLQRLAIAGWVHLIAHTTESAVVVPSLPPELHPVEYPGMWRGPRKGGA